MGRAAYGRNDEGFKLLAPKDDCLVDALSILELQGDLARTNLSDSRTAFTCLFPHFFQTNRAKIFVNLVKRFLPNEDLALAYRRENLKISIEGTISLVANSGQQVDWAKAGDAQQDQQGQVEGASEGCQATLEEDHRLLHAEVCWFYQYRQDGDSSNDDLSQELSELRKQLQSMKKQVVLAMDQSRKSSEREKIALQQAQEALALKEIAVAEVAQAVSREDYILNLMTDASLDMAGSFLDVAAEDQRVDARSDLLVKLALQNNSSFWATPDRTWRIVRFQDRAGQVREYLEFCTKTLAMVYNAMFPRNLRPKTIPDLMDKFKSAHRIHGFVKAQLMAGARFAMIMLQICYPKLDMSNIVEICHAKLRKRKKNVDKINDVVTPVADKMIDDLIRMDANFFMEGHYADFMGATAEGERVNIDDLIRID
ncbi:hypothetical protein QYE76_038880 [Lolium multiflorum]|uniref:Uncharacterized protein n=1 Tax=Lolium multiflorum TaxID=4521 RepID=A0AAD8WRB0_LOLMU|nr:hypothetical protein QYE76_038880 [Lolium multiflorum]